MEFSKLLSTVGEEPAFETGLLLAGDVNTADVRRQLSRWTRAGRLYQLRRGLYALAPPYQKVKPHPFTIANRLVRSSYVSCQSALAHYGLIPEYVPTVTSVTSTRPAQWQTPLGVFDFRHVSLRRLRGYQRLDLGAGQWAFVATAEKALLDLIYLHPGGDTPEYLRELRLQHLDSLNLTQAQAYADSPKLQRALKHVQILVESEAGAYQPL
jgi:predicted transcriptional regulator of viral defense system